MTTLHIRRLSRQLRYVVWAVGMVALAYVAQRVILVQSLPLWWRMTAMLGAMALGMLAVKVVTVLLNGGRTRRSGPPPTTPPSAQP